MPSRTAQTLLALLALLLLFVWQRPAPAPIRIGVLYSLSGPMAPSTTGLVEAARLAVEEINAEGGLLGRPVEMVLADAASDWTQAALEAERLIAREGVSALFACWTSACRKAVAPVVQSHNHLMFYPLQYEGLEQSPNVLYLGAAPNQQIIPGTRWALERFGKRVFLVGSDYVFPRMANQLIRDLAQVAGGEIVDERYAALTATDFADIAQRIAQLRPDSILNTLNGQSNEAFFQALAVAGLEALPVISFSLAEPELQAMPAARAHRAHHAVWGYFQQLDTPANQRFIAALKARFGPQQVSSDPIAASYLAIRLWANAVRTQGTDDPAQLNQAIRHQSLAGPAGVLAVDAATRHVWRRVYVGHARADGQFDVEELSEAPIRPDPFPPYRSQEAWQHQLERLGAPARTPQGMP